MGNPLGSGDAGYGFSEITRMSRYNRKDNFFFIIVANRTGEPAPPAQRRGGMPLDLAVREGDLL
jgi:hypothetical protein